jgi:hypothetical protein
MWYNQSKTMSLEKGLWNCCFSRTLIFKELDTCSTFNHLVIGKLSLRTWHCAKRAYFEYCFPWKNRLTGDNRFSHMEYSLNDNIIPIKGSHTCLKRKLRKQIISQLP